MFDSLEGLRAGIAFFFARSRHANPSRGYRREQFRGTGHTICAIDQLVDMAKLRWRIVPKARLRHDERDYQELKQEVGLGHYEGRGWRGFHHHITLSIAAYGFLISERETIPPSGPPRSVLGPQSALPEGWRPRGSPAPA